MNVEPVLERLARVEGRVEEHSRMVEDIELDARPFMVRRSPVRFANFILNDVHFRFAWINWRMLAMSRLSHPRRRAGGKAP